MFNTWDQLRWRIAVISFLEDYNTWLPSISVMIPQFTASIGGAFGTILDSVCVCVCRLNCTSRSLVDVFCLVCRSGLNDSSLASQANIVHRPAYLMPFDILTHLSLFQSATLSPSLGLHWITLYWESGDVYKQTDCVSMLKTHLQMCVGGEMLWCCTWHVQTCPKWGATLSLTNQYTIYSLKYNFDLVGKRD